MVTLGALLAENKKQNPNNIINRMTFTGDRRPGNTTSGDGGSFIEDWEEAKS